MGPILDPYFLLLSLILSFGPQALGYMIAAIFKFDKVTDLVRSAFGGAFTGIFRGSRDIFDTRDLP
jgi:hypothetical protein